MQRRKKEPVGSDIISYYYCPMCAQEEIEKHDKDEEKKREEERRRRSIVEGEARRANTFNCPKCHEEYDRREVDYCQECGAPVWKAHSCKCGHEWEGEERHCPDCGRRRKYRDD